MASPTADAATTPWRRESWRDLPAAQQPDWPDAAALEEVTEQLRALPPLVLAIRPW
jgi:3-deoxy-7-phosphoheptulonate synthase